MSRRLEPPTLLVVALLVSGCAGTAFEGQRDLAVMRLEEAKEAGASKQEVEEVRDTIQKAKNLEERAARDQEVAREDLEWARNELPAAESRIAELERMKARTEEELATVQSRLQDIEAERDDLLDRGLTAEQIEAILGVKRGVLLRRSAELEVQSRTIAQRLDLARLDVETAQLYMQAAEARLQAAQDRVAVAGALYNLADEQGRVLEAQALRDQRGEVTERLSIEPTGETPPIPASTETDESTQSPGSSK